MSPLAPAEEPAEAPQAMPWAGDACTHPRRAHRAGGSSPRDRSCSTMMLWTCVFLPSRATLSRLGPTAQLGSPFSGRSPGELGASHAGPFLCNFSATDPRDGCAIDRTLRRFSHNSRADRRSMFSRACSPRCPLRDGPVILALLSQDRQALSQHRTVLQPYEKRTAPSDGVRFPPPADAAAGYCASASASALPRLR